MFTQMPLPDGFLRKWIWTDHLQCQLACFTRPSKNSIRSKTIQQKINSKVIRDNWAWVYTFPSIRKTEAEWPWIQAWATQSGPDPKIPTNKTTNQSAQSSRTPSKTSIEDQGKWHEDPWQLYENSQRFGKTKIQTHKHS